jgi:cytochrome c oxidase assembly factor CtaG
MQHVLNLLAVVLVFAAIVPVLTRGGQLIASFMVGREIVKNLALTFVALLVLFIAAGIAAALITRGNTLWAATTLAALPWAAHKASDWFVARPQTEAPTPKETP